MTTPRRKSPSTPLDGRNATFKPKRGRAPSSSLRAARSALYRRHILDAAEVLFAEYGYESAKMQQIAQDAGISLTTLYAFFSSKTDLYRAALIRRDEEMLHLVTQQLARLKSAPKDMKSVLELLILSPQFFLQHPNYLKMQLRQGRLWYAAEASPSAAEQAMWAQGFQQLCRVLEWGQAQGWFVKQRSADLARLMLATQQTRLANWLLQPQSESTPMVLAAIQADFVRLFCVPVFAHRLLDENGSIRDPYLAHPVTTGETN